MAKRKRRKAVSSATHAKPSSVNAHKHTQKDMQFWEEIPFAEETLQDHTESQFRRQDGCSQTK